MQIDIADAVLDEMPKACANPEGVESSCGGSLDLISWPSWPSDSAKDDKEAKGCVSLQVLSVGSGGFGLKMREWCLVETWRW